MNIKTGDTVVIIAGKDINKHGKVLKVIPKANKVIVEGRNIQTKHQKQTRKERSDIKHIEGPIDASNVMYWDAKAKSRSRIGHRIENGKKVRYAKKSGQTID
jgi:large subunit ribosomal protein L24